MARSTCGQASLASRSEPAALSGLFDELLDHALCLLVLALAELRVPDAAALVDEVERRPVAVPVCVPGRIRRVEGHRERHTLARNGIAHIGDLALDVQLRCMHAGHREALIAVARVPG